MFGGWSFFVIRIDMMMCVYDSGSDIEDIYGWLWFEIFNVDIKINYIIYEIVDYCLDNKVFVVIEIYIYRIIFYILYKFVYNFLNDYRFFLCNVNLCIYIVVGEVLLIILSYWNIYLSFVDFKLFFFLGFRDREFSCYLWWK